MRKVYFMIIVIFVGCKSIDITDANKTFVKSGSQFGKDFLEYDVKVSSKTDFTIENISIENEENKIEFYYKDLKTGESSYSLLNPFKKGNYSFHFKIEDTNKFSNEEFLIIEYTSSNKKKFKKIPINKEENKNFRK